MDDIFVILIAFLVYKFQDFKRNINKKTKETIIEGEFRNIDSEKEWEFESWLCFKEKWTARIYKYLI